MARELLDGPLQGVVFGDIVGMTCGRVKARTFNIFWNWHKDIDVVGNTSFLVVTLDLDNESDSSLRRGLHNHINRKERLDSDVKSVAHEFEFSIRRDEGDEPLVLKPSQSDALMELYIVEFHSFVLGGSALSFIVSLIIEAQLEIGHSRKLAISIDDTNYLALDDVVGRSNQHGQFLDDIKEKLVFGVLDAFWAPGDDIGNLTDGIHLAGYLGFFCEGIGEFIGLGLDISLQQFDLGGLGIAVVHHLIKKFIDDDEVVSNGLFLHIFEVALEDADEGVQKGEDHDCVVVFLGDSDEVEVVVLMEVK